MKAVRAMAWLMLGIHIAVPAFAGGDDATDSSRSDVTATGRMESRLLLEWLPKDVYPPSSEWKVAGGRRRTALCPDGVAFAENTGQRQAVLQGLRWRDALRAQGYSGDAANVTMHIDWSPTTNASRQPQGTQYMPRLRLASGDVAAIMSPSVSRVDVTVDSLPDNLVVYIAQDQYRGGSPSNDVWCLNRFAVSAFSTFGVDTTPARAAQDPLIDILIWAAGAFLVTIAVLVVARAVVLGTRRRKRKVSKAPESAEKRGRQHGGARGKSPIPAWAIPRMRMPSVSGWSSSWAHASAGSRRSDVEKQQGGSTHSTAPPVGSMHSKSSGKAATVKHSHPTPVAVPAVPAVPAGKPHRAPPPVPTRTRQVHSPSAPAPVPLHLREAALAADAAEEAANAKTAQRSNAVFSLDVQSPDVSAHPHLHVAQYDKDGYLVGPEMLPRPDAAGSQQASGSKRAVGKSSMRSAARVRDRGGAAAAGKPLVAGPSSRTSASHHRTVGKSSMRSKTSHRGGEHRRNPARHDPSAVACKKPRVPRQATKSALPVAGVVATLPISQYAQNTGGPRRRAAPAAPGDRNSSVTSAQAPNL